MDMHHVPPRILARCLAVPARSPRCCNAEAAGIAESLSRAVRDANLHADTACLTVLMEPPPKMRQEPPLELAPIEPLRIATRTPSHIPERECHLLEFLAYLGGAAVLACGAMAGVVYALVG